MCVPHEKYLIIMVDAMHANEMPVLELVALTRHTRFANVVRVSDASS